MRFIFPMDPTPLQQQSTRSPMPDISPSVVRLVGIGFVSAALFSLTFVINASLAQTGSPWQLTAALRYFFTIPLLIIVLALLYGKHAICNAFLHLCQRIVFWVIAGTLACGVFYTGIAFAADVMPGWAVAATWQVTIVASVIIVSLFSRSFSFSHFLLACSVVVGVFLVNWPKGGVPEIENWLALALLLASAIAYPVGNQLLNREIYRTTQSNTIPVSPLQNPLFGILLLALGSLPFWIGLLIVCPPGPAHEGQLVSILMTTVCAGILATGLFFYARNRTSDPKKITAVDMTQSSEVIFAMIFEIAFVHAAIPSNKQGLGIIVIVAGLGANCLISSRSKQKSPRFVN